MQKEALLGSIHWKCASRKGHF